MLKKIIDIVICIILILPTVVFADNAFDSDNSYEIISNASKTILSIVSWFGYVIALGMLIWIGIKYMLSSANERSRIKGTMLMYLIGVAMIVLCSTIAKSVSNISSSLGDNSAEGIVDKGLGFKDLDSGDVNTNVTTDDLGGIETWKHADGNIELHIPARIDVEFVEGNPPKLIAPKEVRGREFEYWIIIEKDIDGNVISEYKWYGRTSEFEGADNGGLGADKKYEVWAVYENDEDRILTAKLEKEFVENANNSSDINGDDYEKPEDKPEMEDNNISAEEDGADFIGGSEDDPYKNQNDKLDEMAGIADDKNLYIPSEEERLYGRERTDRLNNYYWYPRDGKVEYADPNNWNGPFVQNVVDPTLEAFETETKVFSYWYVIKKDAKTGQVISEYKDENSKITLVGSDEGGSTKALYDYEVYAIYNDKN